MEKIAAAMAMQWNAEFDKGLRSQKPGSQWEAILKLGLRLRQWSIEPPVSAVTASLFKLDPGQDQAFANAVMLHLAEAFRNGNNFTKFCILKVLLLEMRSRKRQKTNGNCKGLLTKERIPNYVEVLKRVRVAMDSGDIMARALSLRVIGCLADLAKDNADVHGLIIEALDSPYQQEVNAGLYSMGCLCEVSDSFSSLALERLVDFINAMKTSPESRIRAIHVFSQMHRIPSITLQAHETGKVVMLQIPTDEIVVTTLDALSRLAYKSTIILADQVELLLSYLCSDPRAIVHAVSLKCLIRLADKATGWIGSEEKSFEIMISILEDVNQPSGLQTLALEALRKLAPHYAIGLDNGHLVRLMSVVELSALHPNWSSTQPALHLAVELACNVKKMRQDICKALDEQMGLLPLVVEDAHSKMLPQCPDIKESMVELDFVTRVALLICDQVSILGCQWSSEEFKQTNAKSVLREPTGDDYSARLKNKCHFLCELLLRLVQNFPESSFIIVDCLTGMLESALNLFQQTLGHVQQENTTDSISSERELETEKTSLDNSLQEIEFFIPSSSLLRMICLCLRACVSMLVSKEEHLHRAIGRLMNLISICAVINVPHPVLRNLLSLLLTMREYTGPEEAQEIATIAYYLAKCFLKDNFFWAAYKVSVWAACHGLWTWVPSVMDCLLERAQSEGCDFWLKALASICVSEADIQTECRKILDVNTGNECSNVVFAHSKMKEKKFDVVIGNIGDSIARALPNLRLALGSLAAAVNLERTFEFQRWLLALRIKCLHSCGELIGLLVPVCLDLKESDAKAIDETMVSTSANDASLQQTISSIQAVARKVELLSSQFKKLAMELDILCISFMGIDNESSCILLCTALGCSFLSFCTTFVLCFPQSGEEYDSISLIKPQLGFIANDLYQRLEALGEEEWPELLLLSLQLGYVHRSSWRARKAFCASAPEKKLLTLIMWAVKEVLHLQEDAKMREPGRAWVILVRGIHLLKDILVKWQCIPWRLPKHFFCTKPRVGLEAFVARMDNWETEDIVATQGSFLSLSLCFQIQNLHVHGGIKVKKLSCALVLKPAERHNFVDEEFYSGWRLGWYEEQTTRIASRLSLMEELLLKLKIGVSSSEERIWKTSSGVDDRNKYCQHDSDPQVSPPIVTCNVDETGQAFTSCLLNTSDLQCGLFRIHFEAACLDAEGHHWMLLPLNNGRTIRIVSKSV